MIPLTKWHGCDFLEDGRLDYRWSPWQIGRRHGCVSRACVFPVHSNILELFKRSNFRSSLEQFGRFTKAAPTGSPPFGNSKCRQRDRGDPGEVRSAKRTSDRSVTQRTEPRN